MKRNANARDMVFTPEQYEGPSEITYQPIRNRLLSTAYWTGMRLDEILDLTWEKVQPVAIHYSVEAPRYQGR